MSSIFASLVARPVHRAAFARQTFAHQAFPTRFPSSGSSILTQARASFYHSRPSFGPTVMARALPKQQAVSPFWRAAGIAALGLGLTAATRKEVNCDAARVPRATDPLPPPPVSSVNVYELSFGTVCGLCAGVFIKKGAKALAFVLGGVFVLLQYLGASSVLRVDWNRAASRFENLFYTARTDPATGVQTRSAPSVVSLWRWIVDFLTADFQQRASFMAGLALGLRVG